MVYILTIFYELKKMRNDRIEVHPSPLIKQISMTSTLLQLLCWIHTLSIMYIHMHININMLHIPTQSSGYTNCTPNAEKEIMFLYMHNFFWQLIFLFCELLSDIWINYTILYKFFSYIVHVKKNKIKKTLLFLLSLPRIVLSLKWLFVVNPPKCDFWKINMFVRDSNSL